MKSIIIRLASGSVGRMVQASEGERGRNLRWCQNIAVGIVSRAARVMAVTEKKSALAVVCDITQLILFPHFLLQTSLHGTTAGVAYRPRRCRVLLLQALMSLHALRTCVRRIIEEHKFRFLFVSSISVSIAIACFPDYFRDTYTNIVNEI